MMMMRNAIGTYLTLRFSFSKANYLNVKALKILPFWLSIMMKFLIIMILMMMTNIIIRMIVMIMKLSGLYLNVKALRIQRFLVIYEMLHACAWTWKHQHQFLTYSKISHLNLASEKLISRRRTNDLIFSCASISWTYIVHWVSEWVTDFFDCYAHFCRRRDLRTFSADSFRLKSRIRRLFPF